MSFAAWKADFLSRTDFPEELAPHLVHLPAPARADKTQAEARKTLDQYLALTVTDQRIATGQAMLMTHADSLRQIKNQYGVDRHILVAIWGMETNFGQIRGDVPVFAALASLAAQGRRQALFEDQLLAAAQMVTSGQATPDQMIGSWAGAMGHTQFMPTSYRDFAIPGADIWGDDSDDALASTANYLQKHGWIAAPWGVEVTWPKTLDLYSARHHPGQTFGEWQALGVAGALTNPDQKTTLWQFTLPAGHKGPAFLTSTNYKALLAYNNAPAYAVAVGHLADRLWGDPPLKTKWQGDARGLTLAEFQSAQTHLTTLGFDTKGADGFAGPNTTKAVEAFQRHHNLPVDSHIDLPLLNLLLSLY